MAPHFLRTRVALSLMASTLVGVVFLMTNKPPALESMGAIVIAASVGIAISAPAVSGARHARVL